MDVNVLIANGQLNKVQDYCERLTGPDQKDCYNRLSKAYFDMREFESSARHYIQANEQIVFFEDFHDNRNGWFENDSSDVFEKVENGKYIFQSKKEKITRFSWPQTRIEINEEKDFRIEAEMTKMEGDDTYGYEVAWGLQDASNNYVFGISGNGNFTYLKSKDGKWQTIVGWTPSDAIHKSNATNTLAVQKIGSVVRFFINGRQVLEKPYERGFGQKVGICLTHVMKVAVNRFVITQTPTLSEAYSRIADERLTKGEFIDFFNIAEKAGFSKKEAYVRVAEACLANGTVEAATLHLEKAGWSVKDLKKKVLLDEPFDDNRSQWFEREDVEIRQKVEHGLYHFSQKREKGGWFSWPQTSVNLDESGDFKIESAMTWMDGVTNHSYGIVWGMADIRNCYYFGISANGSYQYGKYENGTWIPIIDWTSSSHINPGNLYNTLAVEKSGDQIKLYINGHLIEDRSYGKLLGQRVGLSLNDKMSVQFDYYLVEQYAPKVAHALALKYAPNDIPAAVETEDPDDLRKESTPIETTTKQ